MSKELLSLRCQRCNRVTKQMPVKPERGDPNKVYFLCFSCLNLNEMSVGAFKFLLSVAVSDERGISLSEALEEVERAWRKVEATAVED